jgi:ABC-type Mn2+/Zn2+ transport system ATPase subunit
VSYPAIHLHDVSVSYKNVVAVWGVNLEIPKGKIFGLIGPNGGGKSSLIKVMANVIAPSAGYAEVFGKKHHELANGSLAFLPQKTAIDWDFPITVSGLVEMGTFSSLRWFQRPGKKERIWVKKCLERVGIENLAERQIGELSGGQQQRALVARALAQNSDLLLLDEPLVGVDMASEEVILDILRDFRRLGKTVILVHHDLSTVKEICDEVALINVRLFSHGSPSEVLTVDTLAQAYGPRSTTLMEVLNSAQVWKK